MRVQLDENAFAPERAHDTDAGLDLRCREDFTLFPRDSITLDTGVHVQLPKNTCGMLVSKSGLNVNNDVTSTGLIDEGYTGSIKVKLYNHGTQFRKFKAGDKITQLVVLPVEYVDVELVDEIDGGERGDNGFGSTGK